MLVSKSSVDKYEEKNNEEKGGRKFISTGTVEIGGGTSTASSFKFGEYTGLIREKPFVIGNIGLQVRESFDSSSAHYMKFMGINLGLENRHLRLEQGNQGHYSVFFDFNQIPHYQGNFPSDTALTPFNGAGTGLLTLPENWQAATTTSGMTNLSDSLKDVKMKTERNRLEGGAIWHLARNWKMEARFRHEHKQGLDIIAGVFGTNGGNPSAMILPQPIDYRTNTANISLGYVTTQSQIQLGYELSMFNNNDPFLLFQNPYSGNGRGAPWSAATNFPTGFGEMVLPPDNQSHRVTLTGGYNLGSTTRLTANFLYNRMQQNDRFRAFSAIPALNAGVTSPLPRDSLNGRIDNWLLNLSLSSRPLPKLDVRAHYRYENRDNRTPQNIYVGIVGDAQNQPAGIANANARINLPYSLEQHKATMDVSYRILSGTRLTLGYDFLQQQRDLQERHEMREHTVKGKVAVTPVSFANGWIEYAHSIRDGSSYVGNAAFLNSHTSSFIDTLELDERFENHASLRKYFLAKRDRNMIRGMIAFIPTDKAMLSFDGSFLRDHYRNAELGLEKSQIVSATVNFTYSPVQSLSGYTFFTYNHIFYDQKGHQFDRASLPSLTDPDQRWSTETQDEALTPGVGMNWIIIQERLDLGVDYSMSLSKTRINPVGGPALTVAPLPDIDTRFHRVHARLNYQLKDDLALRFIYRYEVLRTQDFARDNLALDTLPFVLTMGTTSPDYTAHLFGMSLNYRF